MKEYFRTDFGREKRTQEWKKILAEKTDQELVDSFNREVNSTASASARFEFIILLVDEFSNRGIDTTLITGNNNSIKLNQKVKLINMTLQLIYPDKNSQL